MQAIKGGFRKELFKGHMSTRSGHFAFLGSGFTQTFSQIVSKRVKTISNTDLVVVKHVKRERPHFW